MKKTTKISLVSLALAAILAAATFAVPSVAESADNVTEEVANVAETLAETVKSGTCGTNLTWTLDDEGTLTISGSGAMTNWSSYSSSSYAPWYSSRSRIKKVVIGDGVTSIGDFAFYDCWSLTSVDIGDSVTSIGTYAFYDCWSLTSVDIGDSVTSIGSYAFYNCSKLTSIDIPDSVTSIGYGAFYNCTSLEEMTLPFVGSKRGISGTKDSVLGYIFGYDSSNATGTTKQYYSSGSRDYYYYYIPASLKKVTITDETVIPCGAFYGCRNLTSIEIGESVESIGDDAFYYCTSLTSVEIGDSVESIGYRAFYGCSKLTSVEIGDGVTSIGDYAFYYCTSLTSVTIPDSVTSIGDYAFSWCTSLTSVDIGASVESIGDYAFSGCTSLTSVENGASVKRIGKYAFEYCTSLTSVEIGASVTSIGSGAFYNCTSLTSVHITDIAAWCGISFSSYDSNPLYYAKNLYLNGELVTDLVIPEGVTSIGDDAFYYCRSLTSVEIPDSVTSIGDDAFYNCSDLTIACNPGSYAESYAKENSYEYVYLPSSNIIGGSCGENLIWILQNGTLTISGEGEMPDFTTSVRPEWEVLNYGVFDAVIKDGVTKIGNNAFDSCKTLKSIDIADSISKIGKNAFTSCGNLTSVYIPANTKSIGAFAFNNCRSLTGITVDENNQYYSSDENGVLFDKDKTKLICYPICNTPDSYTVPDTVTVIDGSAFMNCINLTSINLGNGVETISDYAFYNCVNLSDVVMTDSVTKIGFGAFSGCSKLASITIPNSVTSISSSAFSTTCTIRCTSTSYAYSWATEKGYTIEVITQYYTVSYDANGGENAPQKQKKEQFIILTLSTSVPTRDGFDFLGWATSSDAQEAKYQPGDMYVANADAKLYAVWKNTAPDGDINGDGKFDYYDVSKLYAFYRNKTTLDAGVESDINSDGKFDYYDVSKLYAIYRGKAFFN